MNDELISDIYKSKQSSSYKIFLESKKIQDSYWKKFIEEFSRLIDRNNKEYEDEKKSIGKLKGLIESEMFRHLLENNKYYEKVNSVITKEPLVVGKSHTKLLNIYHELVALCDSYKREYASFIEDVEKKMKADYCKFDAETKSVFENVFNTNVCKESFYNTLCNKGII